MTQGATACAAVMLPRRLEAVVPWPPEFSCQKVLHERINNVSVKALLPARGDLLPLARVGSWLLAYAFMSFASCPKNELLDQARAPGVTTVDFPQMTAGGTHDG